MMKMVKLTAIILITLAWKLDMLEPQQMGYQGKTVGYVINGYKD